jgi:hypothetical protein
VQIGFDQVGRHAPVAESNKQPHAVKGGSVSRRQEPVAFIEAARNALYLSRGITNSLIGSRR